jgi:hypothetical protein
MHALSDLAMEVTEALDDQVVELRLEGGEVRPTVSRPEQPADEPAEGPPLRDDAAGEASRITLRLPESLKAQAEEAAALEGISLNTWLTRAVHARLRGRDRGRPASGNRVRGWVQS